MKKHIKVRCMTRREWMEKYRPSKVRQSAVGGVIGCPIRSICSDATNVHGFDSLKNYEADITCTECWDRPAKRDGKWIMTKEIEK